MPNAVYSDQLDREKERRFDFSMRLLHIRLESKMAEALSEDKSAVLACARLMS